ncbi:Charged multivesicular body protein 3 [Blattella germanica]|nr:Charged multivesicular body protein 3 [Blattella germanica]
MGLFGKTQEKNPKDLVNEWSHKIRKEGYQLDRQIRATLRVAGALQKSTEVMQAMQTLVRVPEVAATMRDLSREMMRAGIIEEMLEETMDTLEDQEELEEEAQEEVDKVLWELTAGQLGQAPAIVTDSLPPATVSETAGPSADLEDEEELEDMQSRLQALRS